MHYSGKVIKSAQYEHINVNVLSTHQVLTKTDVVISSAESVSMVTDTCIVARSVHTPLVATCCGFSTFVDVCIKNRRDREDQI